MTKNFIKFFSAVGVFSLILISGCGSKKEDSSSRTSSSGNKKLSIAVIPKGVTHSFWKTLHSGANKAAKELHVEIVWQGPEKEDDRHLQIEVVQEFISKGVDGILLAPLDNRSLAAPVKAAVKRDIPVVIMDSELHSPDFSSFVATDNFEGGKLCAKRLSELLGGKGRVILLRYVEGSASTAKREEGFLSGMKEYAPEVELISTNKYAGATIENASKVSQDLLNRFREVDGVFASNESATQGMLKALQSSMRVGKVKFVGFDSNPTLIDALKKGQINGLAVQDPFKMGYLGVKTLVAVIKGEKFEKRVDTGVLLVTQENINEQEINELLNPKLE